MSMLCLAVIAAIGIWFQYGNTGLSTAATVASMIAAGVGVESFLNTFWKDKRKEGKTESSLRFWQPRRINSLSASLWRRVDRRASQTPAYVSAPEVLPTGSRRPGTFAPEES